MILKAKHLFRQEGSNWRYLGASKGIFILKQRRAGNIQEIRNNKHLNIKIGCYTRHPSNYR